MKRGTLYATLIKTALLRRLSLSVRQLLFAGAALSGCVVAAFATDNLFNLPATVRATLAIAFLAALAAAAVRLFLTIWRAPLDPAKTAVFLEQRYGIDDNRLVNAVHFNRMSGLPDEIREHFSSAAESACGGLRLRDIWRFARLKPALVWCAAGALFLLAYALLFGDHARNAFTRFTDPSTSLTPINCTQFNVTPGDAEIVEGLSCPVRAQASKFGQPVSGLDILVKEGRAALLFPMRADDDGFAFDLRELARDTRYAIKNGNDLSRWYSVTVVARPTLKGFSLTAKPPAYTGANETNIDPAKREADLLVNTRITVRAGRGPYRALTFFQDGQAVEPTSDPDGLELAFDLSAETTLAIDVTDQRGLTHTAVWQCRFKATPDQAPDVRFLNRELNVQAGLGQTVPLSIEEHDDYGLSALELFTEVDGREKILRQITYRELKRARTEALVLPVTDSVFAPNARYKVWLRVSDNHQPPQTATVQTPLTLHVTDLSKASVQGDKDDPYVRLFASLSEALDQQKELRDWVAARVELDRRERISRNLERRQQTVHDKIVLGATLAAELVERQKIKRKLADAITDIRTALSAPLMKQISAVAALDDDQRKAGLNEVVLKQSAIVTALQRILGAVSSEKALDDLKRDQLAEEAQEQKLFEKLQTLKKDLSAFQEEQRKLMEGLEAIDKKEPEDWTDAEEKLLGDLAAKQQDFARFFQAAFNDLSKVENQDFSNSTMADELIEMIEELQKSGAALEKKHIEIATVNEELLGQQAESITANLERWLADAKDSIKWNGEEGGVNPDVPLQDLPEELTDIIGELIDDVSDMEDVEDSTGSSLSAMDDGLGWGVSDGNMDNMSARGITGNIMPNNNEVGGRSGEGRSGKSTGQFVEKEATGKGGRDTPTRLVQSPFEKGTVHDTSKDPQGGATGGGKQSGLGGEGLRGITPDQKPDTQERLPGQQAELKQKAEALLRELNVRNLPTGDLEDAVNKMEQIQRLHASGQGLQVRQVRSDLLSSLKDAQAVMRSKALGGTEARRATTARISEVRHQSDEPTPDGYEESVDAYFRSLAEPAGD